MNVNDINSYIRRTYDKSIDDQLMYDSLIGKFLKSKATRRSFIFYNKKLKSFGVPKKQRLSFLADKSVIEKIIPPGAKGNIRGAEFNSIITQKIQSFNFLPRDRFGITFEKGHPLITVTHERPDFVIHDKRTGKIIIGMNQIDLWSGGAQSNRESNYISKLKQTESEKLLCVVAKYVNITSEKSKVYHTFSTGFQENILCYAGGLENIIKDFFNI